MKKKDLLREVAEKLKGKDDLFPEKTANAKKYLNNAKIISEDHSVKYSAVVLTEESRSLLLQTFGNDIPEGWKRIAHHMTIVFAKGLDNKEDIGKEVVLTVKELGISDMAIAVKVDGYPSKNKIPHITLAVNPVGGKPVMSNDITDWFIVSPLKLSGVVTEIH
jgi:hypothetical protein